MKRINRLIKAAAAFTGTLMVSAVLTAGLYGAMLPGKFFISEGEELKVNSLLPITAREENSRYTLAYNTLSSRSTRVTENTLLLFGTIPVKTVTASTSERPSLVPCGTPFGIKLLTEGVMVVEVTSGGAADRSGIRRGDIIISADGQDIRSNAELSELIRESGGESCTVSYTRDGESLSTELTPDRAEGVYRAGMWVRDSSAGIGTLTYYDPATGDFGGLGHGICDADTKKLLPMSSGEVCGVELTGVIKSERGSPGQLMGDFNDSWSGTLTGNCATGVYGTLSAAPREAEPIEIAFRQELHEGAATMLTSIGGGEPRSYDIKIESIDLSENSEHDMVIRVIDPELTAAAGGIVQGMSGSPIIQDGRLAGAVTHVFIDDPTCGYGIFADHIYRSEE